MPPKSDRRCSLPECDERHSVHGFCRPHARRMRLYGDPRASAPRLTPLERLQTHGWTVVDTGCWEWNGSRIWSEYGRVMHDGVATSTHRLSYRAFHGEIADGMVVRHKCDNPPCMNPDHLELGTHIQNTADMLERGRRPIGEGQGRVGVTAEQVVTIRQRAEAGESRGSIAADLGIKKDTVHNIVSGRTWKWLLPSRPQSAEV